jgi:hypothetical protein
MREKQHIAATDGNCKSNNKKRCRKLARKPVKVKAGLGFSLCRTRAPSLQLKESRPLFPAPVEPVGGRVICSESIPAYCTVTATAVDGMPFATTTRLLAPVSMPEGTSKWVDTVFVPVATPIVLWLCVRA